ncbi:HIT family protein [soil metagenome]
MPTLFSKIIDGDLPGRFVWEDDVCVAFLSVQPLTPGHTLVLPREEVDHWLDASTELRVHLFEVCHIIGSAIQAAFQPTRVGMMIAGMEVPHLHIHLAGIDSLREMEFGNADASPTPEAMDAAAESIRGVLREMGAEGLSTRG